MGIKRVYMVSKKGQKLHHNWKDVDPDWGGFKAVEGQILLNSTMLFATFKQYLLIGCLKVLGVSMFCPKMFVVLMSWDWPD